MIGEAMMREGGLDVDMRICTWLLVASEAFKCTISQNYSHLVKRVAWSDPWSDPMTCLMQL